MKHQSRSGPHFRRKAPRAAFTAPGGTEVVGRLPEPNPFVPFTIHPASRSGA